MIQASFREIFTIYRENFPKIQKYIDEELNADLKKNIFDKWDIRRTISTVAAGRNNS